MSEHVNVRYGPERFGTHPANDVSVDGVKTIYYINLQDIKGFPDLNQSGRRRRRRDDGPLQRFFDPDREHPFLRQLMQTVGPILAGFISTQLPVLLDSLTSIANPADDDD